MRRPSWSSLACLSLAATAACTDPLSPAEGGMAPGGLQPSLSVFAGGGYGESFNFPEARVSTNPGASDCGDGWSCIAPGQWKPTDFDVTIHSRDPETWLAPGSFRAMHGTMCQPYQAADNAVRAGDGGSHAVHTYEDMNFRCRNHMMTALKSTGYGAIYVTPNAMVDLGGGEAVIRFALATLRAAGNDWVDIWITPWEDNLKLPLDGALDATDLQGPPRRAIHVRMTPEQHRSAFEAYYVDGFQETKLDVVTAEGYESILQPPVSTRRDTFELRLTPNSIEFGMWTGPWRKGTGGRGMTWIKTALPSTLAWKRGVVQFGHHSMSQPADGGVGGTWHWDDFTIAPAVPFTILKADRRYVDQHTPPHVRFPGRAPANAHLRFAAYGPAFEVKFDDGPWVPARTQAQKRQHLDRFQSYWTPVPAGTTRVQFRPVLEDGRRNGARAGRWMGRDVAIWGAPAAGI